MSVKAMAWVWDQDIKRNLKFVLLAYADHADHQGRSIFPSYETIAKKTGYSRRQAIAITKKLENQEWLLPDGEGPKGTRRWRIPISQSWGGEEISPPDVGGVKFATKGGEEISPEPSLNVIKEEGDNKQPPTPQPSSPKDSKNKRDPRLDHHAIQTFRETMRFHAQIAWRDDIIETVDDQEDEWRTHLKDWIGRGYNPRNIKDILRTFREGGISRKPPQPEVPKGYSPA